MSWFELQSVFSIIGIYAILAISLNMICGVTGLLQLGHAGFFAIGAYAAGLVSIYFTIPELGFFNIFIGIAAAMLCAGIMALALGIPCLRLRGDYLAIATLGFGEIIRLCLVNVTFPGGKMFPDERIGGSLGISFTEFPEDLWSKYPEYSAKYATLPIIIIALVISYIILRNVKMSSIGRALMCIREDEIAARSMGINVPKFKILSFVISAAFGGLAGALFFHNELSVSPGSFSLLCSIEILLMVVLGGMGSLSGSIIGAIILGFMPTLFSYVGLGEYKQIFYAFMLILLIRIAPNGLFGMNELPKFLSKRSKNNA